MTRRIMCGSVAIGGGAPVSVQSMCTTPTKQIDKVSAEIARLYEAGCDIVRLAVADMEDARAFAAVREKSKLPLVADIHFDYRLAIESAAAGADKIRINPGNIGDFDRVKAVADACSARKIPIRIGVNGGSLPKDILARHGGVCSQAIVESAILQMSMLHRCDFEDICFSLKASSVPVTMAAYMGLSKISDCPLHLGVTEAGGVRMGTLKSAACIGGLLSLGIGDTIRVSLTADPVEEVIAARDILKAVGLGSGGAEIISCPTCGRCRVNIIEMAGEIERALSGYRGKKITVAVMGCAVNGPGEASHADIGIAGGDGEALLFKKGVIVEKIPEDRVVSRLLSEINNLYY